MGCNNLFSNLVGVPLSGEMNLCDVDAYFWGKSHKSELVADPGKNIWRVTCKNSQTFLKHIIYEIPFPNFTIHFS